MKTYTILLLFLLVYCPAILPAQSSWLWAKNASPDPNAGAYGWSVSANANGDIFVTGAFSGTTMNFGTTVLSNADPNGNQADIFIAKYDFNGNLIWAKSAGGLKSDAAYSVCADAFGNAYITGEFESASISFGAITLLNSNPSSGVDLFFAKYDNNGNPVWARSSSGSEEEYGVSLSTDPTGNVFLTGYFNSHTMTLGSTTIMNAGNYYFDSYVAKYDSAGSLLWLRQIGYAGSEQSASVKCDQNGNAYITGSFDSPTLNFGSFTLTNNSPAQLFLAKYNPSGTVTMAATTTGYGSNVGMSVAPDQAGNVYVTGLFTSATLTFGAQSIANNGYEDAFIAKFDASGNAIWANSAGGPQSDWGMSVSVGPNGQPVLTGNFSGPSISFNAVTLTVPAGSDAPLFIVKYDINGDPLCADALASGGNQMRRGSNCFDPYGNIYYTGCFGINHLTVGSTVLTKGGGDDMFVAKYSCENMYVDNENALAGMAIFPVPSDGKITIQTKMTEGEITVTNMLGNIIYKSWTILPEIDLTGNPPGVYFINVETKENHFVKKVIIR
jgi:hypothetical protein